VLESTSRRYFPLDRLSLLISLVLVGLTLSLVLDLPSQRIALEILGSDASITVSGHWLIALLLAALTAAGVNAIVRQHPRVHLANTRYILILWILPATIVVTATWLLSFADVRAYGAYALLLVAIAGAFLAAAILGQYVTIDLNDRAYNAARLGVNLIVYLVAWILFAAVYNLKVRSLFSAPAMGIASGLLALELLRSSEAAFGRTWLYATLIGLVMAEVVWALNYWNLPGHTGGILLLTVFYAATGIVQQYLWERLNRIVLIEFALVVLGALVLLFGLRLS
jgi:hypothetical protein